MSLQQTLTIYELLDRPDITGTDVKNLFDSYGLTNVSTTVTTVTETSRADFIQVLIPGKNGKTHGGSAPTLGLIGRNGAIGGYPDKLGLVSDADGAIAVLAAALKLIEMQQRGFQLAGDVIVGTHISPDAPVQPREPVDFMGMPVSSDTMNQYEVHPDMDAILSTDTSKGNRTLNHRGFAMTATVKEGCILRVSPDLLSLMDTVTGNDSKVMPITMQDITPYDNGLYHINSIMQPCIATAAPVVGLPITAQTAVAGSATGASHEIDIAEVVRFMLEVAKAYGIGRCRFYDAEEYERFQRLYGPMTHLSTMGQD